MNRLLVALAAGIVGLPAAVAGAAPSPSTWVFTNIGQVLGPASVGEAPGSIVSDPTAAVLPDRRIRVYFAAQGGIRSAVSSDGQQFTVEPGRRLEPGQSGPHTRILQLPDGRWRLYFNVTAHGGAPPGPGPPPAPREVGIGSAISSDGLAFTLEPGLRIDARAAGVSPTAFFSPGDVIKLGSGGYRLYFSVSEGDTSTPERQVVVKSAVSRDLLDWTVERGVRFGPPSTGSAEHPSALLAPDGSVMLLYGRPVPFGLYLSTSKEGLTFTSETMLIPRVLDSAIVRRPDGAFLLYYGDFSPEVGGTVHVGKLTPRATAQSAKKPVPKCKKGQKPTKKKPCRK